MELLEQLRNAIRQSGLSNHRIAELSGVSASSLTKFMHGRGLTFSAFESICNALSVTVTFNQGIVAAKNKPLGRPKVR